MKYDRFTKHKIADGKGVYEKGVHYIEKLKSDTSILHRLAELEDKMERSELLRIEDVAKLWDKIWGSPCEYEICGENAIDVIWKHTDYNWCERNCGTVDSALCWEEYLKAKLKELQK